MSSSDITVQNLVVLPHGVDITDLRYVIAITKCKKVTTNYDDIPYGIGGRELYLACPKSLIGIIYDMVCKHALRHNHKWRVPIGIDWSIQRVSMITSDKGTCLIIYYSGVYDAFLEFPKIMMGLCKELEPTNHRDDDKFITNVTMYSSVSISATTALIFYIRGVSPIIIAKIAKHMQRLCHYYVPTIYGEIMTYDVYTPGNGICYTILKINYTIPPYDKSIYSMGRLQITYPGYIRRIIRATVHKLIWPHQAVALFNLL